MDVKKNRRSIADRYLRDAVSREHSSESQASAAFEAGYFYLLVATDAPTGSPEGTHPSAEVLRQAALRFGLESPVMKPGLDFIRLQYSPKGVGHLGEELLAWARKMQAFALAV